MQRISLVVVVLSVGCSVEPCTVERLDGGGSLISCPDGTSTTVTDGQCSVNDNGNGTSTLTCPDGTTLVVPNAAGGDGGAADGGPLDGGVPAGADGGEPDGGAQDGGLPDGGGAFDGGAAATGACYASGWCWEHPLPFLPQVRSVWARGADDVFFFGPDVAHFSEGEWSMSPGPAGGPVWSSGANDGWVGEWHFDGTGWTKSGVAGTQSLSGTRSDAVFALADGRVHRWDGATWRPLAVQPSLAGFDHVVATASDVWLLDDNGVNAQRWNGSTWSLVGTPFKRPRGFVALSAGLRVFRATDVVAQANLGEWDWSGSAWTAVAAPNTLAAGGSVVPSSEGAFVGTRWRFRGGQWSETPAPASEVDAVGVAFDGTAWAGAYHDPGNDIVPPTGLSRWDGERWSRVSRDGWAGVNGKLVAVSPTESWVPGGPPRRFDGTAWSSPALPAGILTVKALWGASATDVWGVGDLGVLVHWDGTRWTRVESPTTANLTSIWGASAQAIWAVGNGVVLRWNGANWTSESRAKAYQSVRGSSATDVWAVSAAEIDRFDGTTWTSLPLPPKESWANLITFHDAGPWSIVSSTEAWILAFNRGGNAGGWYPWCWDGASWRSGGTYSPWSTESPGFPSFAVIGPDLVFFLKSPMSSGPNAAFVGRRSASGWTWTNDAAGLGVVEHISAGHARYEVWGTRTDGRAVLRRRAP